MQQTSLQQRLASPPILAGLLGGALGVALLQSIPGIELRFFARGAAKLAGLFSGAPVLATEQGWLLPLAHHNLLVTAACSGTGFYLMLCMLLAGRLACPKKGILTAGAAGFGLAMPLAMMINALRIVLLAQAHDWVIPRLPENYGPFAHMLIGIGVFLPALITLNALFEFYGHPGKHSSRN